MDAVWLSFNNKRYGSLVKGVQGSPMRISPVPALAAYALMVLSLYSFVFPAAKASGGSLPWRALRSGALFGLILYGIFNATNMAIFGGYSLYVAILDTLWGSFLFFTVTLAYLWLLRKPYKNFLSR